MTLGEVNKQGSLDRIQGIRLSEGRKQYDQRLGDVLKLNEYVKGWTDMDTFLRMASIIKEVSKG